LPTVFTDFTMAQQEGHMPEWMQAFMAQQQQQMAQLMAQQQQQAESVAYQQQQMQEMQEQHQAQVQALQGAVAQTNETIQALQQPASVRTPQAPAPVPPTQGTNSTVPTPPRRTKAILPDPPKFDGTRADYEGWKSLIKDKIDIDAEVIGSERNQFLYISSRLEEKGLQLALTFITTKRDAPDASADLILEYLDGIFGDRHKTQRAVETLRTMKQGPNEFFSTFLPRFEKTLADAGGMAWPDEVKRSYLDGALTFELRRLAIPMPVVTSYSKYVNELLRLSDLYRATMKHAPKDPQATRPARGSSGTGTTEPMDWEPTRAAAAANSGQKRRAKWVSQEEMDKRRQEGRCFRCGSSEHQAPKCEFLRPIPPGRGPRVASGKVVEPLLEPEESEPEVSPQNEELN
jgi:hypothetical protein